MHSNSHTYSAFAVFRKRFFSAEIDDHAGALSTRMLHNCCTVGAHFDLLAALRGA